MKKQLGILLGCGATATALVAINVVPADEAAATGLVSLGTCSDALDHLKTEARERVGPWGLDTGTGGGFPTELEADGAERATAGDAPASDAAVEQPATQSHSTTNVQEIGVDEPDIVKTDGRLIVTVLGSTLRVVDTTGSQPVEVGSLPLGERLTDANLLFDGERAMVFSREYAPYLDEPVTDSAQDTGDVAVDDGTVDDAPGSTSMPSRGIEMPTTTITLVDLSEPADPSVLSSLSVDGNYLDARMVDGTVRTVISSTPTLPFPLDEWTSDLDEEELVARNRQVIDGSTIEDWLPSYRLDSGDDTSSGTLVPCERLNRPVDFSGFSTMSVLTLDFDGLSDGDAVGVLTDGDTVYASTDRLYVATAQWAEPVEPAGTDVARPVEPQLAVPSTGIHAFAIDRDGPAEYLASGEVDGQIIGRYAMSEHEGVLRVATTTGEWENPENSESHLITLGERDDQLVEVGSVSGLGKGERIYAVRYFGDTGYVVTFRQVDPLYVLDLSDPSAPSVEGELKITGYSSYLHPIEDERLVGVGQEATEEGQIMGAQVSLFDVSDATDPRKLDGHVREGAWSGAETDPHAFLYWPDTRQLVVPISGVGLVDSDEPVARDERDLVQPGGGALVLTVDGDRLVESGLITHGGTGTQPDYWTSILRSIVIDDALYTLWYDGLQVNDLDDLELRSWLPIDQLR